VETSVTLPFADGTYRFWLGLPQWVGLERSRGDTSLLTIEERLRTSIGANGEEYVFLGGGGAMLKDVCETIRFGLIGGNSAMINGEEREVGPIRAQQLVEEYVCPARPLEEGVLIAWRILHAAIYTVQLKKKVAGSPESESPPAKAR